MTNYYRSISKFCPDISDKIAGWQKAHEDAIEEQMHNPFSQMYCRKRQLSREDPEYGYPMKGTKTYARGVKAAKRVSKEIRDLCDIIYRMGDKLEDGSIGVKFGRLWATYVAISDKVVGMLIRARKHGYVSFPGEILYQGQDEEVMIRLIKLPKALAEEFGQLEVATKWDEPEQTASYAVSEEGDSGYCASESDRAPESQADESDVASSDSEDEGL